jgi:hypothetical protein
MLTVLVAVAIVVFSLVSELSRVSQQGLDEAIVKDAGLRGSYQVTLDPSLEISPSQAFATVMHVADGMQLSLWGYWQDMPSVTSECPPYEKVGPQQLRILWQRPSVPFDLPFGQTNGLDTQWCIDGQTIPASALYVPDASSQAVYGTRLYLRSDYANLVLLSTLAPVTYGYVLVSGDPVDQSERVREAVIAAFAPAAEASGIDLAADVTVRRLDQSDQNVLAASNGVAVTYGVIGWGVLVLAGLALLVVQVSNVRQRSWFYGLARALGARGRRIGALLGLEAGLVLVAGSAIAIAILLVAAGPVNRFADAAFGVDAHVLNPALLPKLAVGMATLLVVTTVVPLAQVLRRDPLEVLEAPRD